MYLVPLKTLLVDSVRRVFDADYIQPQFRGLHASIEYPDDRQHYPGLWIDFEVEGNLEPMGVGDYEIDDAADGLGGRQYSRWRFLGYATYTVAALTSLERDLLYDELIRIFAFGGEAESTAEFRAYVENNDLVACNFNFDRITTRGLAATPGTPWGSSEMIYECTVAIEVVGEFVSDSVGATLVPLSQIVTTPYLESEPDPDPGW